MPISNTNAYREPFPSEGTTAKDSAPADIQYRDIAYVYPVTLMKDAMGSEYEEWASTPIPVRCSWQEHALDSQHVNLNNAGSRFARVYTREPNAFDWHDRVCCRDTWFMVTKNLVHYDNYTGEFHHAEIRGVFIDAPQEIQGKE